MDPNRHLQLARDVRLNCLEMHLGEGAGPRLHPRNRGASSSVGAYWRQPAASAQPTSHRDTDTQPASLAHARRRYLRTVLELASVRAVLTDFDRTLALLFGPQAMEVVRGDLADLYASRRVPVHKLRAANAYTLWIDAYNWMIQRNWSDTDVIHQGATDLLGEHEYRAAQESRLLQGVRSMLEWLNDLRIPVAIVSTNATRAVELALKVNQVEHLVSVVLGRKDEGVDMARLKPDPSLIHHALKKVHGGPALLVGDSIGDIEAGRRAGLPTVGVTTGELSAQELKAVGANVVIPSFGDLRSLFASRSEDSD